MQVTAIVKVVIVTIGFQKKKPIKEQNLEFPIRLSTDGTNTTRLPVGFIRGECLG